MKSTQAIANNLKTPTQSSVTIPPVTTVPVQQSKVEPRHFAFIPSIKGCFAIMALMAGMWIFSETLFAIEQPTTTTLSVSPATVNAGTPTTLTASVMRGANYVTRGLVVFCDANAAHCQGSAVFGAARLTSSGRATLKLTRAVGTYSIAAIFIGTVGKPTSASLAQTLVVAGNSHYTTATGITQGGTTGRYTLTGVVAAFGRSMPVGSVLFLDASNGNSTVGSAVLNPLTRQFGLVSSGRSTIGSLPYSVASGDFDNDGKMDLAVPNADSTVSVLLGKGDGTFEPQVIYSTDPNGTPYAIATGDFNGDGNTDIVVTNSVGGLVDCSNKSPDTVSILLGNGDGSFQPQQTYAVGFGAQGVVVGDFNDDGNADIAVTNNRDNTVGVLFGNGDGTFQAQVTNSVGNQPSSISTADFNGDGEADLVVSNLGDNSVSVLLGNGNGTFQRQVAYATGNYPVAVAAGDVSGDGNIDLAVTNSSDSTVSVLLGRGDGTFASLKTYVTGNYPFGVAIGDFNGDGKADLATSNFIDHTVSVLLGNGNGTFPRQSAYAAGNYPVGMAIGDFNGDGLIDVAAVAHTEASVVSVLLSQHTATATITGVSLRGHGIHNVLATYSGDTGNVRSQSATLALAGVAEPTTTRLAASSNPEIVGHSVTFTATVSPTVGPVPSGAVSFYADTTLMRTVNMNGSGVATFATASLARGSHSITALYLGNANFNTSTSSQLIETINEPKLTATRTTLTVPTNSADIGQAITFSATVTPAPTGTAAGTVTFYAGTMLLQTVPVKASGVASITTRSLARGRHSITAVYSGNANFKPSTSNVVIFMIESMQPMRGRASATL